MSFSEVEHGLRTCCLINNSIEPLSAVQSTLGYRNRPMFLVPYYRSILRTHHRAEVVVRLLRQHTMTVSPWSSPASWFSSSHDGHDFVGKISDGSFRIRRKIPGRNTYMPLFRGSIAANSGETEIRLVATLHPTAIVLMTALFIWPIVLAISETKYSEASGVLAAVFLFHVAMYFLGFVREVGKMEERLNEILKLASS